MTKKVLNIKKIILFIILLIILMITSLISTYLFLISSVSKEGKSINIYIEEGSSYSSIATMLKEKGLIRSSFVYKIYIKLNEPTNQLEYGNYVLKTNYTIEEIISMLEKGSVNLADTISVTFIEGKNMRHFIKNITEKFNITSDEILNKLNDDSYLDILIDDYWFLSDEIKNNEIYYPLEGYLFPDTYEFYTSADIDDIFRKLLDEMGNNLESYKGEIEKSGKTIHEILTLSSIVELEGVNSEDRKSIAGVFNNRLNDNWSLGSDPTTYYAEKIDDNIRDLKQSELDECNAYNTRSSCMQGKLPVGPICNPSLDSIIATIEPEKNDYYYFVADKNGKNYFNKTEAEHNKTINELKSEGLWITY